MRRFLLVKLHMDSLAELDTPGPIHSRLEQLSADKSETFRAVLGRIEKLKYSKRKIVSQVLSWLLCADRPITVDEVRHALAIDCTAGTFDDATVPPDHQLTSFCAGIVVIDQTQGVLQLVHDSIREHLRESSLLTEDPHGEISLQCLTYITLKRFEKSTTTDCNERLQNYPLFQYAADTWFAHFKKAKQKGPVERKVIELLRHGKAITLPSHLWDGEFPEETGGLHACAYFGQESWAEELIGYGIPVDYVDWNGQTALHWAARMNQNAVLGLLIAHGAQTDVMDNEKNTPLHLAVSNNHEEAVRQLLQANANPGIYNSKNFTPYRWAIKYQSRTLATVLAENRVEVDIEDQQGWTPVKWAIWQ